MDKRGLQHFSKMGSGQQRANLLQRDIVLFPYTFDYLQEIPSGNGSYLEFVTLGGGCQGQLLERHVRKVMAKEPQAAANAKVTVVGLGEVRAEHINQ